MRVARRLRTRTVGPRLPRPHAPHGTAPNRPAQILLRQSDNLAHRPQTHINPPCPGNPAIHLQPRHSFHGRYDAHGGLPPQTHAGILSPFRCAALECEPCVGIGEESFDGFFGWERDRLVFDKTKRPDRSRGVLRHQNMPDMHFRSTHIAHNFNPRASD